MTASGLRVTSRAHSSPAAAAPGTASPPHRCGRFVRVMSIPAGTRLAGATPRLAGGTLSRAGGTLSRAGGTLSRAGGTLSRAGGTLRHRGLLGAGLGSWAIGIPGGHLPDSPDAQATTVLALAMVAMAGALVVWTAAGVARGIALRTRSASRRLGRYIIGIARGTVLAMGTAIGAICGLGSSTAARADTTPSMRLLPPEGTASSSAGGRTPAGESSHTMVLVDAAPPSVPARSGPNEPGQLPTEPTTTRADTRQPPAEVGEGPMGRWWTVEPGDNFWDIAVSVLRTESGPTPVSSEVHRYWRQLIDANRNQLADPDNPDLLFCGQVLQLPPPGGSG